jgi:L-amino acid N-acyltransferase YncA
LSIYIAEAARGKGIGRYCLEQAIAFAPSIGVHTLLGFIFGHNQPSLGLFKKFGFDTWANLPRVATLDGVERDLIILGKRVG